jgi:hypothetical protein
MKRKGPPWKIEKIVSKGDYNYAIVRGHPNATKNSYVLEHRIVMENKIGRLLKRGEIVHHINEKKKDNRPSNLRLLDGISRHMRLHGLSRGSKTAVLICPNCKVKFERHIGQTYLHKQQKNKATCCSRNCRGIITRKIQLGRIKESSVKKNIVKVYRKIPAS